MWMEREKEERDEARGKRDGEREGWMKRQNNGESNKGERQGGEKTEKQREIYMGAKGRKRRYLRDLYVLN